MATRRQARKTAVSLVYAFDLGNNKIEKFADEIFEERKIRNKQKKFAQRLFNGVLENISAIDRNLKKHITGWEFERIGHIEKAILRIGAFEILYTDTDNAIVINEAIEIAKELGAEQSPKFINGVLDSLSKEVNNEL
jgi:N utilization substance protein B